jgi:hypothetical protein
MLDITEGFWQSYFNMNDEMQAREKPVPTQPGRNGGTLYAGSHGKETGRPKGSKNRSTLLRKWADAMSKKKNPLSGLEEDMSQEEIADLALIFKAQKGDVSAYKELKDTLYGKLTDNVNLVGDIDLSQAIKITIGFDEPASEDPKPITEQQ